MRAAAGVAPQGAYALLPNLVGFGISELTVENVKNHEHGVEDRYKLLGRPDVLCPQRQGQKVLRPLSSLRPCGLGAPQWSLRHEKRKWENGSFCMQGVSSCTDRMRQCRLKPKTHSLLMHEVLRKSNTGGHEINPCDNTW